jgi:hypothetical protein
MVGFNRRYAPLAQRMRGFFGSRARPMSVSYRANIGYRPPEHWMHDSREGGGVISRLHRHPERQRGIFRDVMVGGRPRVFHRRSLAVARDDSCCRSG